MERVLVTGANGMLATNIIEQLLDRGYAVNGLLRRPQSYKGPLSPELRLIAGDFKKAEDMARALEGCSGIFHVAARTAQTGSYADFEKVNFTPIEAMMEAALKAGIRRVLYVSTANTIGSGTRVAPADENTPWTGPLTLSYYARTKAAAEKKILEYFDRLETVVVNPTFMVGRYGSPKGSNTMLSLASTVSFCPKGGKNIIDVEEAARAMILAYEKGRNGEKYIICGENYSFREFYRLFPQVKLTPAIPKWLMKALGWFGDLLHRVGLHVAFTSANMGILMSEDAYRGDKAASELGFTAKALDAEKLNSFRK